MYGRLNIWLFDEVLCDVSGAMSEYKSHNPGVADLELTHDPDISSEMILTALPRVSAWKSLPKTPGSHWVVSQVALDAVELWTTLWQGHPELGPIVNVIERVFSTSDEVEQGFTHAQSVVRFISDESVNYPEVVLYSSYNWPAFRRWPHVRVELV